jgi:hypothetical protein
MIPRLAQWAVLVSVVSVPAIAVAWTQQAPFSARVHEHEFRKVIIESTDCVFRYRLYFTAPAEKYPAAKPQTYRFHNRIKLLSGKSVISPIWYNTASGDRMYKGSHDTSAEGCWAKEEQKPIGVSVEGCRGKNCAPDPFD